MMQLLDASLTCRKTYSALFLVSINAVHLELVERPGDVPVTYADSTALERDFGFVPRITLREGLCKFSEWYKEYKSKSSLPQKMSMPDDDKSEVKPESTESTIEVGSPKSIK